MQAHDNDGELFYHLQHQVYPWHKTNLLLETIRHNSDINQSALCVSPVTTVKCSLSGFVSGLNAIIKSGWIIPELPSKKYYCKFCFYTFFQQGQSSLRVFLSAAVLIRVLWSWVNMCPWLCDYHDYTSVVFVQAALLWIMFCNC